ncbi:MAG: hypothetical protein E4H37_07685 [Gemmatimonadales bacterium]|nr:MAG: hypothetical protein E4H37_07685 [Gemmatimonadales bacterium]
MSHPHEPGSSPAEESGVRAIMHRVAEIERDASRAKRLSLTSLVTVGVILGLAAALVYISAKRGMPGTVNSVVESRQYLLRDAEGRVRGIWGTAADGTVRLVLRDQNGRSMLKINLLADGSSAVTFADTTEQARIVLGLLEDETSTLVLADGSGRARAVLGLSADGSSTLVFADTLGVSRSGLGIDAEGGSTATFPTTSVIFPEEEADSAGESQ